MITTGFSQRPATDYERILLNNYNTGLYSNLLNSPNIQLVRQPDIERTLLTVVPKIRRTQDTTATVLTVSDIPRRPSFDNIPVIPAPKPTRQPRRRLRPTTPVPTYDNNEVSSGEPYSFAYEVEATDGGASMKREESRGTDGVVRGMYSYLDPEGIYRIVDYTADASGFNAKIRTNEPGTSRLDGVSGRRQESNYFTDPANTAWEIESPPAAVTDKWFNSGNQVNPSGRRNRIFGRSA